MRLIKKEEDRGILHGLQIAKLLNQQEWKQIWRLRVQHRLKLLLWKIAAQALPLCSLHFSTTMVCPLCGCAGETLEHLILECSINLGLWYLGPWPLLTTPFHGTPIHTWFKFILNSSNLPRDVRAEWHQIMLAVSITLDTIQNTRNKIFHEQKSFDIMELSRSIQRRYHAQCEAWNNQRFELLISWLPPRENTIKINFDASLQEHWISVAAVCSNGKGEIIQARICKLRRDDPLKGEARAARLACLLAEDFADQEIWMEGRCIKTGHSGSRCLLYP